MGCKACERRAREIERLTFELREERAAGRAMLERLRTLRASLRAITREHAEGVTSPDNRRGRRIGSRLDPDFLPAVLSTPLMLALLALLFAMLAVLFGQ